MDLKGRVKEYLLSQDLLREGDRVIVGISGGADSVCLFLLLLELKEELSLTVRAVHIEHGIRGEESLSDQAFVMELCREREVPLQCFREDVPGFAEREKVSIEEGARILRYRCFYRVLQEEKERAAGRVRIAVAHHREDQAETVLFQLIRGSSLKGLGGMRPLQGDLIRPLLFAGREEILSYLREKGQSFRKDSTNEDTAYARNRIRKDILPVMEKIHQGAARHIAASAEELRELEEYLEAETARAMELAVDFGEEILIRKEALLALPVVLRRSVLYEALGAACGGKKDITRDHVASLLSLMELQSGRQLSLPCRVNAQRTYLGIRLVRRKEKTEETERLRDLISLRVFPAPGDGVIPKKKYTKWLDYDKIKNTLLVRTRCSGDYLMVDDKGSKKTLKKYFIDEKIPEEIRGTLPLLCDGAHVVWVVGHRISAYYKVTEATKQILEAVYIGGPIS